MGRSSNPVHEGRSVRLLVCDLDIRGHRDDGEPPRRLALTTRSTNRPSGGLLAEVPHPRNPETEHGWVGVGPVWGSVAWIECVLCQGIHRNFSVSEAWFC